MPQAFKDSGFVSSWYQDRISQYGNDHRSLGYNQRSSQLKRFDALRELGNFNNRTILDMGCGFGDFLQYLHDQNMKPNYTGIDICAEMIDACMIRFQERLGPLCRFEVGDILDYKPQQKFDYVIACGLFGLFSEHADERIVPTLNHLFSCCRTGLAVNFLSQRSPRQTAGFQYVDPSRLLKIALDLTPAVRLSHNYLPNDFTLYLYRTPPWEQSTGLVGG